MVGIRELWNSPVVAAYLLWRFVIGYQTANGGRGPSLALAFPALAVTMQPQYSNTITRSIPSLRTWTSALIENGRRALLDDLQDNIRTHRELVLKSIETALVLELVGVDPETSEMNPAFAKDDETPEMKKYAEGFRRELGEKAERFGKWCGMETPERISKLLGVYFK